MRSLLVTAFLVGVLTFVPTCSSDQSTGSSADISGEGTPPPPGLALPPPQELLALYEQSRALSYVDDDLILHGRQFADYLPHQNVSINGDSALFAPDWETTKSTEGLSYCVFPFQLEGFDLVDIFYFNWDVEPLTTDDYWVGTANWTAGSWDWYRPWQKGYQGIGSFDECISESGAAMLVMVFTHGDGLTSLRWIKLGDQYMPDVVADLVPESQSGLVPFTATLDPSLSDPGVGAFTSCRWDWEGGGHYDLTETAAVPVQHTYDVAGEYEPQIEVTTEFGLSDTAQTTVSAHDPWDTSFGGDGIDRIYGVAASEYGVFFCGRTSSFDIAHECIYGMYNLDGSYDWAYRYGTNSYPDEMHGVAIWNERNVVFAGRGSRVDPDGDLVIASYTPTEYLIDFLVWGTDDYEAARGIAIDGDKAYIVGSAADGADRDILVARFDLSTFSFDWARCIGGNHDDYGRDICLERSGELTEIHIIGVIGTSETESAMLYAKLSDSGDISESYSYDVPGQTVRPWALAVDTEPDTTVFLHCTVGFSGADDLSSVIEFKPSGAHLAIGWEIESAYDQLHNDMLLNGDSLVIAGTNTRVPSVDDNQAYVLKVSTAGAFQSGIAYTGAGEPSSLNAVCLFPGNGYIVGGSVIQSISTGWSDFEPGARLVNGTWSIESLSNTSLSGAVKQNFGSPQPIDGGTHDSGGGEEDTLLSALAP